MELDEAIKKRKSIRGFLDRPIEKAIIEEILSLAIRAPSYGNTQPWELVVVGGETLKAAFDELYQNATKMAPFNPDFTQPDKFPPIYQDRYRAIGHELYELLGIKREDKVRRFQHVLENMRGFGATCLICILLDEALTTVYSVLDCGFLASYICLIATARGLGTMLSAGLPRYPDIIRKHLCIQKNKKILLGILIGYIDPDEPANKLVTKRAPLTENIQWIDID